jgi:hypothetical protein
MRLALHVFATVLFGSLLVACGGGGSGDDGDDGDDTSEPPTAYRADSITLMDPHLFALDGAVDVTSTVNTSITTGITEDGDDPPDGQLDLSIVLVFRPIDVAGTATPVDAVVSANCTAPLAGTSCTVDEGSTVTPSTATNGASACLTPEAGTTGGYDPAVGVPAGPCFVSDKEVVTLIASGVELELQDTLISADYGATGAPDRLEHGLLIGFMTEETANNTTIPADTPIVGGEMLATLLKDEDKDTGPGGASGWWFFFNFEAGVVPFSE